MGSMRSLDRPLAEINHVELVDAAFSTLEMLLPHAARMVEQKTQALVEQVGALLAEAHAQEQTIGQLVACVQHIRLAQGEVKLDTLFNRTQVSLAFSMEHNLELDRKVQDWNGQLQQSIALLKQTEQALSLAQSHASVTALNELTQRAAGHLQHLQRAILEGGMDARERAMYREDMQAVADMLSEQPARTRQLQTLLEDANLCARAIAKHGHAAVTAIQFQDYNTQLIENALKLLRVLRANVTAQPPVQQDAQQVFETCLGVLTLGEIRHMFMQNLKQHLGMDHEYQDLAQGAVELFQGE